MLKFRAGILAGLATWVILSGCVTATPEPTETPVPTATDTSTPKPTATKTPTRTPTATPTELPTNTPTKTRVPATRVPKTAAPVVTDAPTGEGPTAEAPTATEQVQSFAPTVATVWQLGRDPLSVNRTDACTEDLVLDFYGLVALAPQGTGMTWRRQDGLTYTLGLSSPNNYYGSGASSIPDHSLSVGVTFTSPTTLLVSYTLTPNANADCHYTWNYDGTFQWNQ